MSAAAVDLLLFAPPQPAAAPASEGASADDGSFARALDEQVVGEEAPRPPEGEEAEVEADRTAGFEAGQTAAERPGTPVLRTDETAARAERAPVGGTPPRIELRRDAAATPSAVPSTDAQAPEEIPAATLPAARPERPGASAPEPGAVPAPDARAAAERPPAAPPETGIEPARRVAEDATALTRFAARPDAPPPRAARPADARAEPSPTPASETAPREVRATAFEPELAVARAPRTETPAFEAIAPGQTGAGPAPASTEGAPLPSPTGVEATAASARPAPETTLAAPREVRVPTAPVEEVPVRVEWLAERGGGSARIQLDPPELGRVELAVRLRGPEVEVVIAASEPATQAALQQQRGQLADGLASRDLRLTHFDVGDSGSSSSQDRPDSRGPDPERRPGLPFDPTRGEVTGAAPLAPAGFTPGAGRGANTRIDLRA